MPSQAKSLWLLTVMALLAGPIASIIYWDLVLSSGTLSPDSDTISIPIMEGIIGTLVIAPLVFTITWLCVRRYNPETTILAWRKDRPIRSLLGTIVFCGAVCIIFYDVFCILFGLALPYEYVSIPTFILRIWWLLAMRAAVIEQLAPQPVFQSAPLSY